MSDRVSGQVQKGVNSIVILGAWNLWNQRNRCVFDGADPDLSNIISNTKEDLQQSVESETLAPKAQECWMGLHARAELGCVWGVPGHPRQNKNSVLIIKFSLHKL